MKKCPVKHSRFFGDYQEHTFGYISKTHRKCLVCGIEEILFEISDNGIEDWRTKYKKP